MPPKFDSRTRQRVDGYLADLLVWAIAALCLSCWGPIPLACLWIGSEADYLSGSVFLGMVVAFLSLFPLLFGTLLLLRHLDNAWTLVRRAAGRDQRKGVLGRVFALTAVIVGVPFLVWLVVIHGPGRIA